MLTHNEQAKHDAVEMACGSVERAFHLMQIHNGAVQSASDNNLPSADGVFKLRARSEGYTEKAIKAYLEIA